MSYAQPKAFLLAILFTILGITWQLTSRLSLTVQLHLSSVMKEVMGISVTLNISVRTNWDVLHLKDMSQQYTRRTKTHLIPTVISGFTSSGIWICLFWIPWCNELFCMLQTGGVIDTLTEETWTTISSQSRKKIKTRSHKILKNYINVLTCEIWMFYCHNYLWSLIKC